MMAYRGRGVASATSRLERSMSSPWRVTSVVMSGDDRNRGSTCFTNQEGPCALVFPPDQGDVEVLISHTQAMATGPSAGPRSLHQPSSPLSCYD